MKSDLVQWRRSKESFRLYRMISRSCKVVSLCASELDILSDVYAELQSTVEARQKLESQQQENKGVQKVGRSIR